jgi:uncharacterized repeat protein (TIGR03943 family)
VRCSYERGVVVRRETQNILLALLGAALLKLAFSGAYLRYVKASLLPWVVAAGIIMIILAVVAIARDMIHAPTSHHEVHDHSSSSRSPWLLLLPLLAVFLINPPALGADTVNRSDRNAVSAATPNSGFAPLPQDAVVSMSVSEFVTRTAWDDSGSLNNRTVKLSGFIVRKGESTYVARLAISCCAADASPVRVLLAGRDLVDLPADQWIEVTGRVVPGSAIKETAYVPTMMVSDIVLIPTPENTYEG